MTGSTSDERTVSDLRWQQPAVQPVSVRWPDQEEEYPEI
jgi:hypothetical protein